MQNSSRVKKFYHGFFRILRGWRLAPGADLGDLPSRPEKHLIDRARVPLRHRSREGSRKVKNQILRAQKYRQIKFTEIFFTFSDAVRLTDFFSTEKSSATIPQTHTPRLATLFTSTGQKKARANPGFAKNKDRTVKLLIPCASSKSSPYRQGCAKLRNRQPRELRTSLRLFLFRQ